MEKKVLVAVAAALMSSVGALHPESARAADAAASAYEDSTVDASLDPGEERISADADNQARLKDLRYAYFIGYNARAREDSKSYATLGDEVKHPQKQLAAPCHAAASPKPVAERVAPPRRAVAQAASLRAGIRAGRIAEAGCCCASHAVQAGRRTGRACAAEARSRASRARTAEACLRASRVCAAEAGRCAGRVVEAGFDADHAA